MLNGIGQPIQNLPTHGQILLHLFDALPITSSAFSSPKIYISPFVEPNIRGDLEDFPKRNIKTQALNCVEKLPNLPL